MSASRFGLQRAEEVQEVLLLLLAESVEVVDDGIGLGRREPQTGPALVRLDRLEQVGGAAVVEEEDALPQTPQRRRPELVRTGPPLDDVIREPRPHVVQQQVRKEVDLLVPQCCDGGVARGERRRVAEHAADVPEEGAAVGDGGGAAWHGERPGRRGQEPHEESELFDGAEGVDARGALGVGDVFLGGGELAGWRFWAWARKSSCLMSHPLASPVLSTRPLMTNRACTPPSRVPLALYWNRASRTGPSGLTKNGT